MGFEAGRLPPERLLDLLERQERLIKHLQAEVERLKQRLAQYEPEAGAETPPRPADRPPPSASYSLEAEQRRRRRGRPRRRPSPGRRPTELKFSQAHTTDAKRVAADGRLSEQGRKRHIAELEGRLCELCRPSWHEPTPELKPPERDFVNLVNELMRLLLDEELFTFVLHPEVQPTNNALERLQRNAALERKAGRTSKTAAGARRRSIIVSVLESLRANLESFTLASVLAEVQRWLSEGRSLFQRQWQELQAATATAAADTG